MIKSFRNSVAERWCSLMHNAPMWPAHGHYRCRKCGHEYPVPWERDRRSTAFGPQSPRVPRAASRPQAGVSVRPAQSW